MAIEAALRGDSRFSEVEWMEARPAADADLLAAHTQEHVEAVRRWSESGGGWADADTYLNAASDRAARLAAGACAQAARDILAGERRRILCAVRPPGHHATRERAMGFCLFNNACVAAYAALGSGAARIAVVDFDVHHGNGTQDILWTEPRALYVSLHQSPLYPGTGRASETGGGEYGGTILNLPLPPGTGDREYLRLVDERVLPALVEHRPDLIIVSAGYDCLGGDPLAGLELTAGGVKRVAEALVAVAGGLCGGRLLVTLEGGYALDGLVEGVAGTLEALL